MLRRHLLAGTAAACLPLSLLGCSGTQATTLAMAQSYLDTSVNALLAAAQAYLAGPPAPPATAAAQIKAIMGQLVSAQAALDKVTVEADWKSEATKILATMNELTPTVSPYLGEAAPYLPLAIAVVQAFINSLPPPADAPPTPPAALKKKAALYRH